MSEEMSEEIRQAARRGRRRLFGTIYAAIIVAILIGAVIYVFANYRMAVRDAEAGNFTAASAHFNRTVLVGEDRAQLEAYIHAGLLMEAGRFDEAAEAFAAMGDYRHAGNMYYEVLYQKAASLAEKEEFTRAIALYELLSELGYRDSAALIDETRYRMAESELEAGRYQRACDIAEALASTGYADAPELKERIMYQWAQDEAKRGRYLEAAKKLYEIPDHKGAKKALREVLPKLYAQGQAAYREEDYALAWEIFSLIDPYEKSGNFLTLIYVKYSERLPGASRPFDGSAAEAVAALFDFEDASRMLLTDPLAQAYLEGRWQGEGLTLTFQPGGLISYNLPGGVRAQPYAVKDGVVVITGGTGDTPDPRPVFSLKLPAPDKLEAFCHLNGQTYTLYR